MEQGPMTTSRRSSAPCKTRWIACRAWKVVVAARAVTGYSLLIKAGGTSSLISLILTSSVTGLSAARVPMTNLPEKSSKRPILPEDQPDSGQLRQEVRQGEDV